MGLAESTRRVLKTEPTIFIFVGVPRLTLSVKPMERAKREVSVAVSSTPPLATKDCRRATPSQPRPGRMSSVESFLPTRLGVSGVFFQGSGLPQLLGKPLMMAVEEELNPTGGKRITSYFELRSSLFATVCVLMSS